VVLLDVGDQVLQLVFGALGGEIGDLRLEGAGQVGGGIDDALAESQHRIRPALEVGRKTLDVRVQPDAQQGVIVLPGGSRLGTEIHDRGPAARRVKSGCQFYQPSPLRAGAAAGTGLPAARRHASRGNAGPPQICVAVP
jgi:hypothetical protein